MTRLIKFIVLDILKNRIVLIYTLILAILSWSVFSLEDNSTKGVLTLLNVVLLVVPLVSVIFSTIYIYNSSEFIELMVSQPIKRSKIWWSLFFAVNLSLLVAFAVGAGIPILIYAPWQVGVMMLAMGSLISAVFVSLSFLSSVLTRDKAKGIGIAIMLWLFFALIFDGLVLFLSFQLADYPIEKPMVAVMMLNPIDLARILILLHLDISVMLGYTGAIFKSFFGATYGITAAILIMFVWIVLPFMVSMVKFRKKDM